MIPAQLLFTHLPSTKTTIIQTLSYELTQSLNWHSRALRQLSLFGLNHMLTPTSARSHTAMPYPCIESLILHSVVYPHFQLRGTRALRTLARYHTATHAPAYDPFVTRSNTFTHALGLQTSSHIDLRILNTHTYTSKAYRWFFLLSVIMNFKKGSEQESGS
jgi:hypothetical protein